LPEERFLGVDKLDAEAPTDLTDRRQSCRGNFAASLHLFRPGGIAVQGRRYRPGRRLPAERKMTYVDDPAPAGEDRRRIACADVEEEDVFRTALAARETKGERDGADIDHRNLSDVWLEELGPFSDKGAGGKGREDLRPIRPYDPSVIDEHVLQRCLDHRLDGKAQRLTNFPVIAER
jgi:hypothetical protein